MRRSESPLRRSRAARRSSECHGQSQLVHPEPPQLVVLAYMLAAARAERRGQGALAQEFQDCARALVDRLGE